MAWDSSRFKFRNEIPQLEGTDPVSETTVGGLSLDEPQATKDSIPAYVDYTAQTLSEDPKKPARTYTGLSLRSTLSNTWSSFRDYGVSHFNVPRLAAPWEHEIPKNASDPPSHTVREFKPSRQKRRLLTNSSTQFGITLLFCAMIAGTLGGYASVEAMTDRQKHCFNALITLWSIFLGLNLASSFRSYAQMMRWRFLASRYRKLQEFELVLQCESQSKVIRLFWTARTKGRLWLNKVQILCLAWLGVNILMQVLVALLGFTYNIDGSAFVNQVFGTVSIVNLTIIEDYSAVAAGTFVDFYEQLAAANTYGIVATDYPVIQATDFNDQTSPQTIYTNPDYTIYTYRFEDQDPDDSSISVVTERTIASLATCRSYRVLSASNGSDSLTTYHDPDTNTDITIDMQGVSPGAMTYSSRMNSQCGPRCTQLRILQSSDSGYTVVNPHFFLCNNTVSQVSSINLYTQPPYTPYSDYALPDTPARALAGAIGWSGFYYKGNDWQSIIYSQGTAWSPEYDLTDSTTPAQLVMAFSMGAVAAMDWSGPRANVTNWTPVPAQKLDVDWRWAASLLGVVPVVQGVLLGCIILWAGAGVVIKDTGYLSMTRLLGPVVLGGLGGLPGEGGRRESVRGCLLTSDEIAEELQNVRVRYGWRGGEIGREMGSRESDAGMVSDKSGRRRDRVNGEDGVFDLDDQGDAYDEGQVVRHIDLLEEREGLGTDTKFPAGRYDGLAGDDGDRRKEGSGLIRRRRGQRRKSL